MSAKVKPSKFTIGVGAAVVRDGRLLMVKHNYGPKRWQIPGGLVELGETIERAACREVAEETSIRAIPEGIFAVRHRITEKHNNLYVVFRCRTDDAGEPVPDGKETSEAAFLTVEEIENLTESWQVNVFLAQAVLLNQPHLLSNRGDPEQLDRIYELFA